MHKTKTMTQLTRWNSNWTFDPFDVVWKNILDTNSTFNTIESKINYPVDIYETETGLRFELAVVGLNKSDIEILVESDILRITHDKQVTEGVEKSYIQRGITRRSFDLAWKVASKLNLAKLEANMDKGLLIIDIPYAEEKAPKKVTIK
jgi:HSP20 family molecular chaperone IbpA